MEWELVELVRRGGVQVQGGEDGVWMRWDGSVVGWRGGREERDGRLEVELGGRWSGGVERWESSERFGEEREVRR